MKIRLHVPAFINNHRYGAGEIVELPDGVKGPHKSVRLSADHIDYDPVNGIDANHAAGQMKDEPLYDIVEDEKPAAEDETPKGVHDGHAG